MILTNRSRGFITLDGMVSLLPILLIIFLLMQSTSLLSNSTSQSSHYQKVFNKLVAVADYTVKSGAAIHHDDLRYPNWIDEQKIDDQFISTLRQKTDLKTLYISTIPKQNYPICIYRIVVTGSDKTIKKLFVCGG